MTRTRTAVLLALLALPGLVSCSGDDAAAPGPAVEAEAPDAGAGAPSSDAPPPPLTPTALAGGTDTAALDPCTLLAPEDLAALGLVAPGVSTADYGRSCGWDTRGLGVVVGLDAGAAEQAVVDQFGAATPRVLWGREGRRYPTDEFCSYFFTLADGSVLAILAGAPDGPRCLQAEEAARHVLPRAL